MAGRRRLSVTREGWYYLFVVLFILGGAVLREVNLLVGLAGLMIGPLLFNWRLAGGAVAPLRVERLPAGRVSAGQTLRLELRVGNRRRRSASWMVQVTDTVQLEGAGRSARTRAEMLLPTIAAGRAEVAAYRVQLPRRGRYKLGPVTVASGYPLGLFQVRRTYACPGEALCWPTLGRLTPAWRAWLRGDSRGSERVRSRRGGEGEIYGLRPWSPGDSRRQVHWRTTARVGAPVVRQNESLEQSDLAVVLDAWADASPTAEQLARLELAISVAGTIVLEACRQLGAGRVSLTTLGAPPRHWRGAATARLAESLLDELAVLSGGPGNVSAAVERAREADPGAALVVVSTRPRDSVSAGIGASARSLWLDVASPELAEYYLAQGGREGAGREGAVREAPTGRPAT